MKKRMLQGLGSYRWAMRHLRPYILPVLLLLLLDAAGGVQGVLTALVTKQMVDRAIAADLAGMLRSVMVLAFIILAGMLLRYVGSVRSGILFERFTCNLRMCLYRSLLDADWKRASAVHSGDWVTRLTEDVADLASVLLGTLPGLFSFCVQLLFSFIVLYQFDPWLAILAFAIAPVTLLASRIWGRKLRWLQERTQSADSRLFSHLQETIRHAGLMKTYQHETCIADKLSGMHAERLQITREREATAAGAGTLMGLGYWASYLLAFVWGGMRLARQATTFGTLTAFIQLVQQVQAPLFGLARALPALVRGSAAADRLMAIDAMPMDHGTIPNGHIPETTNSVISFELSVQSVCYAYDDDRDIVRNLDLKIIPGRIIALSGDSGEGKTTLLRLLCGILRPSAGIVRLCTCDANGIALDCSNEIVALRNHVAVVPQGNTLLSGTIRSNLLMGKPDASEQELSEALGVACASEFCMDLVQGIDTVVGEGGDGLSEGQAQRIGIARGLLRDKPILLLDEATSALDADSEAMLMMHLREWISVKGKARSIFMISHRPAVLAACDDVYRMQDGKLSHRAGMGSLYMGGENGVI